MFSRLRFAMWLALLSAIAFALPAFAGGWAVITLDELPTGVVAREPLTIGFTVLQHGKTPMTDLEPTVTARLSINEMFVVNAKPEGEAGHYAATLTFPRAGNWEWSIQAFTMDQAMPALSVAAPRIESGSQPEAKAQAAAAPISPLLVLRVAALAIGLGGLAVTFRRRSRIALAVTGLCLVVGIASFVTGSGPSVEVEAQGKSPVQASSASSISQVELGRQLFIAKGCITCHINSKAASASEYWSIEMGAPNLSNFSAHPDVLRMRLKDPSSVKSDTKMPALNVSDTEIEALIAFINSK